MGLTSGGEEIPKPECCELINRFPDDEEHENMYDFGPSILGEKHPFDRYIPMEEDIKYQIRIGHLKQ